MKFSDADIMTALEEGKKSPGLRCGDAWIQVGPFEPTQLQPASIDLRLGSSFVCFIPGSIVDMRDRIVPSYPVDLVGKGHDSYFELKPQTLVLGTTLERVDLGPRVCAKVEGKSSMGRMGLAVHVTAGFIDPGFGGQITLELYNLSANPIRLRPGLAICQIAFSQMRTKAERPYGSKELGSRYQDQVGAVPVKP